VTPPFRGIGCRKRTFEFMLTIFYFSLSFSLSSLISTPSLSSFSKQPFNFVVLWIWFLFFDYILPSFFLLLFFFSLSFLIILLHLIFIPDLIFILLITIFLFFYHFLDLFYFSISFPHCFISFNFYVKFGPHSFDYYYFFNFGWLKVFLRDFYKFAFYRVTWFHDLDHEFWILTWFDFGPLFRFFCIKKKIHPSILGYYPSTSWFLSLFFLLSYPDLIFWIVS